MPTKHQQFLFAVAEMTSAKGVVVKMVVAARILTISVSALLVVGSVPASGASAQTEVPGPRLVSSSTAVPALTVGNVGPEVDRRRSSRRSEKKFAITLAMVKKCQKELWHATQYDTESNYQAVGRLEIPAHFLPSSDQGIKDAVLALSRSAFDNKGTYARVDDELFEGQKLWARGQRGAAIRTWNVVRTETLPDVRAQVGALDAQAALVMSQVRAAVAADGQTYPPTLDQQVSDSFEAIENPLDKVGQILKARLRSGLK